MNTRLAGTIFEASVVKPVLFCSGALLLGALLAMAQDTLVACWRVAFCEDVQVDACERHLTLLTALR